MLALTLLALATSTVLAAGAGLTSRLLRRAGFNTRGIWLAAMLLMVAVVAVAPLRSATRGAAELPLAGAAAVPPVATRSAADLTEAVRVVAAVLPTWVSPLLLALWIGAALAALLLFVIGLHRQRALLRNTQPAVMAGSSVQVSEDFGPAIVGLRRPRVVVPRWLLERPEAEQRLVLAHEQAHIAGRDALVLAAAGAALVPLAWNPVVWWCFARLRLATEVDCDARVLGRGVDRRHYGLLLLDLAALTSPRLGIAAFAAHPTQLERRVRAMTERPLTSRRRAVATLAAVLVATTAVVAACSANTESPLQSRVKTAPEAKAAPEAEAAAQVAPRLRGENDVYFDFQVETTARPSGGGGPRYPQILRDAGVEGDVLVQFVVGKDGRVDPASIRVLKADHALFEESVRAALPAMQFEPAKVEGRAVAQLIQQPFVFALSR